MIVNADDFGRSTVRNAAVVRAFEEGLVSSATVMPTMSGFDEAVALAHAGRLLARVGVHLTLTAGEPLTEGVRRCRRFCDAQGRFTKWRGATRAWRLSSTERHAVLAELRAQIERARAAGLPVTHVDSHHHVHNEWAIGGLVVRVARESRIPYVRLARNCGPGIGVAARGYKRLFNSRVRRSGLAATRYFGDVDDWLWLARTGASTSELDDFELMTHPVLDTEGVLVDPEVRGEPLARLLAQVPPARAAVPFGAGA